MALTLTVEDGTGLANANSFASLAEANSYHEGIVAAHRSVWDSASDTTKSESLVMATRLLDRQTQWIGERKLSTQALSWPRNEAECDGHEVLSTIVPQPVKDATSELARLLVANDLTKDVEQNELGGISLGKGALKIDFNGKAKSQIPHIVDSLLGCYGDFQDVSGFRTAKLIR